MRAAPKQTNLQAICCRRDGACAPGYSARWSHHDVLAEHHVWLGKALKKAILDHRLRAFGGLFSGLEDCHQCAAPCWSCLGKQFRGACKPRNMHVMSTHVGDRHGLALSV